MTNSYFLTLVLRANLEDKKRKEITEEIAKKLGTIEKEDEWGNRDLAYPIKHNTKGWYVHYKFSQEPNKIPALDKTLQLDEDIIRYLLVRE